MAKRLCATCQHPRDRHVGKWAERPEGRRHEPHGCTQRAPSTGWVCPCPDFKKEVKA